MAVRLFDQQFQVYIREWNIHQRYLLLPLLAAVPLDLFEAAGTEDMGFVWTSEILDSEHLEDWRQYVVTSEILGMLGRYHRPR